MKPQTNYLGEFLKALREERGFANIRDYVRHYDLPVGYVYYTEIESGKKYLALETAKQLCEALNVEIFLFYSNLLKDIVPAEVQHDFLNLLPLSKERDPHEGTVKQEALREAYQKNALSRLNLTTASMTNEAESFFFENHELMPLVAAIYCVESTTKQALKEMSERIGITMPIEEILRQFEALGVIAVAKTDSEEVKVSRRSDIILTHDKRTGAKRVTAETLKTINAMDTSSVPNPHVSNCFYGIVGLSKEKQNELLRLIADLRAEFDSYHDNANKDVQLMAIAFSPIKQYSL